MGIKLLAGRTFEERRAMDDATAPFPPNLEVNNALARRGVNVVINESTAKRLGYRDPAAAVGNSFKANLVFAQEAGTVTIIGVVQDTRFDSVREPVAAIVFRYDRSSLPLLVARFEGADPERVRKDLNALWKRTAPAEPFEAKFSDDVSQRLYQKDEARGQIFAAFALVAVLISSLGLFGLAAFTAERRTKEIGIRKVLGARVRDIVQLLAWQFSKPVVLANLIAWPAAWWVMRDWLNGFDARIELTPGPFVVAGALALIIALGTIGAHALKVARANPIHALRYE
jgi:putative ABC transport system permease protein